MYAKLFSGDSQEDKEEEEEEEEEEEPEEEQEEENDEKDKEEISDLYAIQLEENTSDECYASEEYELIYITQTKIVILLQAVQVQVQV